jgi:hypothetical protein
VIFPFDFVFDDPDATQERLARIEAKLDALTDYSSRQDAQGRLIPRVEWDEKRRRDREGWPKE